MSDQFQIEVVNLLNPNQTSLTGQPYSFEVAQNIADQWNQIYAGKFFHRVVPYPHIDSVLLNGIAERLLRANLIGDLQDFGSICAMLNNAQLEIVVQKAEQFVLALHDVMHDREGKENDAK